MHNEFFAYTFFLLVLVVMARISEKDLIQFDAPYLILRVDNIPTHISLHRMLSVVERHSRYIIGIGRTADYVSKELGTTVFYMCASRTSARLLENVSIDFVGDGRDEQYLMIVDSVSGRAELPKAQNAFEQVPITVHITGLLRYKIEEGFTEYLRDLIPHFESRGNVTCFRLNYDVRRQHTRSDGFVSYLTQRDAREIGSEARPIRHYIQGLIVEASISYNVPVIIRLQHRRLLNRGTCDWSDVVASANQLMVRVDPPPARRQVVDRYRREQASLVSRDSSPFRRHSPIRAPSPAQDGPPTKRTMPGLMNKSIERSESGEQVVPAAQAGGNKQRLKSVIVKPDELTEAMRKLSTKASLGSKSATTPHFKPFKRSKVFSVNLNNANIKAQPVANTKNVLDDPDTSSSSSGDELVIDEDISFDDEDAGPSHK